MAQTERGGTLTLAHDFANGAISPLRRAQTLYEHCVVAGFDVPFEDDKYRYIQVPVDNMERLNQFFKRGYEPAPEDHPGHDGVQVCLRIDKGRHKADYLAACAQIKSYVRDQPNEDAGKNRDLTQSSARVSKPHSFGELLDRLPTSEPEPEA